jgi:hypothetical protein
MLYRIIQTSNITTFDKHRKCREEDKQQHKDYLNLPVQGAYFFFFLEEPTKTFFFFSRKSLSLFAT